MEAYVTVDGLRAGLVLFFALAQAVMAYWPDFRKWPETIRTRSSRLQNFLVPIDWAFAIWGPIFLACMSFAVWQILPANLDDPLSRRIGWLAVALFAGNVLWESYVPRHSLDYTSVAIIAVEVAISLAILFLVSGQKPLDAPVFWFVCAPFQIFAGWVSAALFVNTASALQFAGHKPGTGLSLAMIAGSGGLGAAVGWLTGGRIYAAAVSWALFGLIVANTVRERNVCLAGLAGLMIPLVMGAAVIRSVDLP